MTPIPYRLDGDDPHKAPIGLIVLQVDETIEWDFRHYFADQANPIFISRIPSGLHATAQTLKAMEENLAQAADLLPKTRPYPVVGYGCTSASAMIGSEIVEAMVKRTCNATSVTNPLRAAIACAAHLEISRLALLSPYIEAVNLPLRNAFAKAGISTDIFASFAESQEAKISRISVASIVEAAIRLGSNAQTEAVFLSCTNLRTLEAIPMIEKQIKKPVLSSNQALAWHIKALLES
ncbi:MAG: Asp/Glu racemase [Pseudomonadota bacterium]